MHQAIKVSKEGKRGCGWRKTGGKYLMKDGPAVECGKLPIPLTACPCCGHTHIGTKSGPSRGWTWVDIQALARDIPCKIAYTKEGSAIDAACVLNPRSPTAREFGQVGLLWIGVQHYPTIDKFDKEAEAMGISRRVHQLPRDFVLGETWVALAHRRAITTIQGESGHEEVVHVPGIFRLFKPDRIEVIVDGTEPDEVIEKYLEQGFTPVLVERVEPTQEHLRGFGGDVLVNGIPLPPGPSLAELDAQS